MKSLTIKSFISQSALACLVFVSPMLQAAEKPAEVKPLKALLIAGGCCHDYAAQHKILHEGISKRANIQVDVVWTREGGHDPNFQLFHDPNWAKGYDFIIHDECAALTKNPEKIANILNAHKTLPAVHLHCAMHSFRGAPNDWQKHLGIKSDRHGPRVPITVEYVNKEHPITAPLKDWLTSNDELYNNVEVYDVDPLAIGTQKYKAHGGKQATDTAIVVWTNTKFDAPSFSTSLGHTTEVVQDPRYLDLVTRGSLWVTGKLDNPAYHTAYTGENSVKEIDPKFYNQKPKKAQQPKK